MSASAPPGSPESERIAHGSVGGDRIAYLARGLRLALAALRSHDRSACLTVWDNGKVDGFARASGDRGSIALGYYTDADHPFYTWLATTFATSDRYFAAVLDKTSPNRHYLYAGQNTPGK